MYKISQFVVLFILSLHATAQYKNDNVLYKSIYAEDVAQQLKANPGYLLLDVRTRGENQDTSMMGMNIGYFKTAKNIDVRELGGRLNEIKSYKNTPVFVYCSHSQRSRRASKMLADSGFTKVFNINGGMSTLIQNDYGLTDIYETKNNFRFLSPGQFCQEAGKKNVLVIDVRSDSAYNAMSKDEETNAIGKLKTAVHIPVADLDRSLSRIPPDKMIILIDDYGDGSLRAANILSSKGYKNLSVLFEGIFNLITSSNVSCKNDAWQQNKKYHIITADEFNTLAKQNADITIIDIRSSAEFNNQSKDGWKNIGHVKNAVNIPVGDIEKRWNEIINRKNKPVVIYSFGSNGDPFGVAAALVDNGFTNVNILSGGIFSLRWKAANIKGEEHLKDWVTDIPADNL